MLERCGYGCLGWLHRVAHFYASALKDDDLVVDVSTWVACGPLLIEE